MALKAVGLQVEGYAKLTSKQTVYKLLNKLKVGLRHKAIGRSALQEFSDWHQCQVLEVVSHYSPENEQEVSDRREYLVFIRGHRSTTL